MESQTLSIKYIVYFLLIIIIIILIFMIVKGILNGMLK